MKSLEIRSKSKEEAINKAIEKLNVKLDDLEIEVLENLQNDIIGEWDEAYKEDLKESNCI